MSVIRWPLIALPRSTPARTDLFLSPLMAGKDPNRVELVEAALERAKAYRSAGAGSFFHIWFKRPRFKQADLSGSQFAGQGNAAARSGL